MNKLFTYLFFFISLIGLAQNEQLAQNYFDKGEFDKATSLYEEIEKKQPGNFYFTQKLASCYQNLKQFDKAEKLLLSRKEKFNQPNFFVELGYNAQLQKDQAKADSYYKKAYEVVQSQPNYAYQIGQAFEQKSLLQQAYTTYEIGQKGNSGLNFDYQMALLQGQMGNLDVMVVKLLDHAYSNQNATMNVQNQLLFFMQDDVENIFVASLKKELLLRTQKNQDIYWNQFLSWLYVNQKEYNKAFIQEKSIYKRNPESFDDIIQLAQICVNEKDNETAQAIFQFILQNTTDEATILNAEYFLLKNEIANSKPENYPLIQSKFDTLLNQYGDSPFSVDLQILAAHFKAFYLNDFEKSKALLDKMLAMPLNVRNKAKVKMEMADVFVFNEKFNQAIIYYAQIQNDLPNDEFSHEASMRMAKTSFFKKDFDWAKKQASELKQASTQLIANDAVELFLLISDNEAEDSLKVALQDYSKADLLEYQNKPAEALEAFLQILVKHKGESIEAGTLYKVGRNYEKLGNFAKAISYYQNILDNHKDGIYIDEALFYSAEIYNKQLNDPEKAKNLYEKIVLEHPDSIYFTEARKQYRQLRGDKQQGI
ncbi:tetratricopeptide repeat protein [Flavobacterium urocaniciphilum]|uniref:Tetratricopeptide repeat-containing protein n=1 Tax=Flavobacterium urocaniciphilum TaxID=1299341 RepID=A0A1H9DSC3_9FLAO|nr:tetratricopeptide repeat protein [Flavobacterium urocaniciphilum]SEQ16341.1 Tetratricopeptide repeat-containing protein [Flavobacterium urocaniciphilum]